MTIFKDKEVPIVRNIQGLIEFFIFQSHDRTAQTIFAPTKVWCLGVLYSSCLSICISLFSSPVLKAHLPIITLFFHTLMLGFLTCYTYSLKTTCSSSNTPFCFMPLFFYTNTILTSWSMFPPIIYLDKYYPSKPISNIFLLWPTLVSYQPPTKFEEWSTLSFKPPIILFIII